MNKSSLKVSDIGEKQLIERIIAKSQSCSISSNGSDNTDINSFKTSIGDDSALTQVNLDENSYLVSSTDMLIQSSHFPPDMTYFQMGYKSVVVNVSDLSSMGADNIGFLLNMAIPKDTSLDDFDELICGVIQACDYYDILLIGGDTNEASEIIISGTAIGQVDKDKALMKYGFKNGDLVCITDQLGYAALGFELLELKNKDKGKYEEIIKEINKIDPTLVDMAIFKALRPEAKYKEGHILRDFNTSDNRIAATDITDGLASEFYEILNSQRKFRNGLKEGGDASDLNCFVSDGSDASDLNCFVGDGSDASDLNCFVGDGSDASDLNCFVGDGSDASDLNCFVGDGSDASDLNCFVGDGSDASAYGEGIKIYEDSLPIEEEFKKVSEILGLDYLDLFFHVGEDFELLFTINRELKNQLENEMKFYVIGEITDNNTVEILLSNGDIKIISSKGYEHLK